MDFKGFWAPGSLSHLLDASAAHPDARLVLQGGLLGYVAHRALDVAMRLERLAVLELLPLLHWVGRHGLRGRAKDLSCGEREGAGRREERRGTLATQRKCRENSTRPAPPLLSAAPPPPPARLTRRCYTCVTEPKCPGVSWVCGAGEVFCVGEGIAEDHSKEVHRKRRRAAASEH